MAFKSVDLVQFDSYKELSTSCFLSTFGAGTEKFLIGFCINPTGGHGGMWWGSTPSIVVGLTLVVTLQIAEKDELKQQ